MWKGRNKAKGKRKRRLRNSTRRLLGYDPPLMMPARYLVFDEPPQIEYCIAVQQGRAAHSYAVPEEDYTFTAALSAFKRPPAPCPAPIPPPAPQHTDVETSVEDPYATFGPGHTREVNEDEDEEEEGDALDDYRAAGQSTRIYDGTEDMDMTESRLHGKLDCQLDKP